jgi:hypothetical protein
MSRPEGTVPKDPQREEAASSPLYDSAATLGRPGSERSPHRASSRCRFRPPPHGHATTRALGRARSTGAGDVDLLRLGFGGCSEGCGSGDAVAVAVGGDGARGVPPCLGRSCSLGWGSEFRDPLVFLGECGVEESIGPGFDEVASLGQRLPHLGWHDAGGFGDEAHDETWCSACTPGSRWPGGRAGKTVVQDRGDVVGVPEPACSHEARQQGLDVVLVGLGPTELGSQRSECG